MATTSTDWPDRYYDIDQILEKPGPRTDPDFLAGDGVKEFLRTKAKILVIGAGGLGCEILANLALTGFKDIHVIDMDTIDISNLNRQFLFRPKDVGRPKAIVAAEFIMNRVPGVQVTPYYGKIQDKGDDYYLQFNLVICGLDSVEARRWMSATLVNLVDPENPESLKPLIDGGTEGFRGQARVILPTITSCYECSLDMLNKPTAFPICTIANTPRQPEHCIEWASVLEWPRIHGPDKKLDNDDPEHITWLYNLASARAKEFNIEGVTWSLTQGVVKNIIPAIASTNAIIAASCCNEAFKIATSSAAFLNNYFMLIGTDGVYSYTFEHEKRDDCPVCGGSSLDLPISSEMTVEQLIELLIERQDVQIKKPSLSSDSTQIYLQAPPDLEAATRPNLTKKVQDLVAAGGEITVTSRSLPFSLSLRISYT
ncbi:E2-bind domain-containing protein [Mycena indigotica]|uniref:NEDD8-activating enzyme E1 catalytic subunit n=1 Tax=Mycena indigotica TaxID=2126181 RepID=A0A8H6S9V2_9AGAR|nr:E2-bind domain-containing protein [Mycena indigotica]KAF7294840.1 E2-bind domain-containing protein [Mycena indigotica]